MHLQCNQSCLTVCREQKARGEYAKALGQIPWATNGSNGSRPVGAGDVWAEPDEGAQGFDGWAL